MRTSDGRTVIVGNAPVENAPVVRSGGRFEGPGKFEIKFKGSKKDLNLGAQKYPMGELEKLNKTCIINNGFLNKKVMEVVGNFKNGLIHGPAKGHF